MNRSSWIFSLAILLLLLIPTPAGKLIINLAGGLLFISFLIPIILTGLGWFGWKLLKSKINNCKVCGASYSKELSQCPLCGSSEIIESENESYKSNIPASSATIDISAEEAD